MTDMDYAIGLVPVAAATKTAARSGNWSDPATWGGSAPVASDKVYIPPNIAVAFDAVTPPLKWLRNDGNFKVTQALTTKLWVELFVAAMGSYTEFGTDSNPVVGQFDYVRADLGALDVAVDPKLMGGGLIPMGQFTLCAQTVTAWSPIAACHAGDTTITLKAPVTGWAAGHGLYIPGNTYPVADTDECVIQSINGNTITLTAPLKFDHTELLSDSVHSRTMYAANTSKRKVHFTSENTQIDRRGHMMIMNGNMTMGCHFSMLSFGRTRKDILVTDPDGSGGGTGNVRGRYSIHVHKNGANKNGPFASFDNVIVIDDPGWSFTNHDSSVNFTNCVAYKFTGFGFGGEIGSEVGSVSNCVAHRSSINAAGGVADLISFHSDIADFGREGYGFWSQGGGIKFSNCIASGCFCALGINGTPFVLAGVTAQFASANLDNPAITTAQFVSPSSVPQTPTSIQGWGVEFGIDGWTLNGNPSANPDLARSKYSFCSFDANQAAIDHGYLSCIDVEDNVLISKGYAVAHTGINGACSYRRNFMKGGVGVEGSTAFVTEIANNQFQCDSGAVFYNLRGGSGANSRSVNMHDNTLVANGNNGQVMLSISMGAIGASLDEFGLVTFCQSFKWAASPDNIMLDGKYVFYAEEGPNFKLDSIQNTNTPAYAKGLTNGQLYAQYGMCIGAKVLPLDAAPQINVSGGLTSATPAVVLPKLYVTVDQDQSYSAANGQTANKTSGFMLTVWDNAHNQHTFGPYTLTDKQDNAVVIPSIDGFKRGVNVYCDSSLIFPSVSVSPSSVLPAAPVTVTWTNIGHPYSNDVVRLYASGAADGDHSGAGAYTNGLANGSVQLTTSAVAGQYEARLFSNDSPVKLATSDQFTVSGAPPPPPPPPPPQATVPNVVGLTLAQAQAALQAVGLVMTEVVATQSPAAGTQVAPGSTVNIT